jgi:hypothetical protein
MLDNSRRVHMADLARYIGWSYLETTRNGGDFAARITAVKHANGHMIVGLASVSTTLKIDENVRLWRPADKIAHLACGNRCNHSVGNLATVVPASTLKDHIGLLAFIKAGSGPGPHIILDCEIVGDLVNLTMSSSEAVGKYDAMVEIAPPHL